MTSEAPDTASFKVSIRTPIPEHHPALHLIGQVASEWALLEHTLDQIIWSLANVQRDLGACVTGQIVGATPRFNAIIALSTRRMADKAAIGRVRELGPVFS
jgi:hypothetical protein